MLKLTILAAAAAGLAIGPISSFASSSYPDKPINVVIGFAPGGPTDSLGRVLFKKISEELGVPMVIENKPGAGGNIAAQAVATAKPDGYTLMFASVAITIAPFLYDKQNLAPKTAFAAVGCSSAVPLILLVPKKVKANTAPEFYKLMRDNPGKYFAGNSGNGTIDQLAALDIASKLNLKFEAVPYKGNGPALTGLMSGDTNFMYSGSFNSALPFIQSGDLKALAVTSTKRSEVLPDVPTLSESIPKLAGFNAQAWQAVMAPKGTPPEMLTKVNKALNAALKDPEVLKSLHFQGAQVMNTTPQECQAFIDGESDRWSAMIKELGIHN
ncbi:tripartite tricarboxylate transporter substrate binding protein [Paralcaligenes sp. KSB-10]|uniref:Bug family tripartite tricarboxylate transporter substrate binding protein n=1 Tax=Paralcaligenes sp. KSB-10 TaxID=2901142 RepID=UPI001E51132F|nr:tripartite tricarboxylate transporter substrate binding protein [Paralcaligenes sp. KSB-10]UHL63143.1 tripartite tricarboxylate transporter substrate binding protein [Paralcaligenes sp. KSB-10]